MITITDYSKLPLLHKVVYLMNHGRDLAIRGNAKLSARLYYLNGFYVEVWVQYNKVIGAEICSKHVIDKYLDDISLDDLKL